MITKPPASNSRPKLLDSQTEEQAQQLNLKTLFAQDPHRAKSFTFEAAGLTVDISRQRLRHPDLKQLCQTAADLKFKHRIQALFNGEKVNMTEDRQVLHHTLRSPQSDQKNPEITACLEKVKRISTQIQTGDWTGYTDKPITDVVNIGIGGSDLGPKMVCAALAHHHSDINVHFVSNVDAADLDSALSTLPSESTLFIVCSKSWSTQETQLNSTRAKNWLLEAGCTEQQLARHFVVVTTKIEEALSLGAAPENILPIWDWVGGRFSLWSAIGLSIAIATSFGTFQELLAGAHEMDEHFRTATLETNLPFLLAATEVWNTNILQLGSQAIIPYSHNLRFLTDHLQQLIMESNGKSVTTSGTPVDRSTSPVVWGSAGTVGQHSYHQLLQQGTECIPVDFILPLTPTSGSQTHHNQMIANCLAQAEVLMDGLDAASIAAELEANGMDSDEAHSLAKHKAMPGNRPSTLISFNSLNPGTLGALVALYEHKVFCSSLFWQINAFDQWGVELGKTVAKDIYNKLCDQDSTCNNPATEASIKRALRNTANKKTTP